MVSCPMSLTGLQFGSAKRVRNGLFIGSGENRGGGQASQNTQHASSDYGKASPGHFLWLEL